MKNKFSCNLKNFNSKPRKLSKRRETFKYEYVYPLKLSNIIKKRFFPK